MTKIERELGKDFQPEHRGGRPVVTFRCDGLGRRIREVSIEYGDPMGLALWHATLDRDGESYDVRGIDYDSLGFAPPPAPFGPPWFKVASARMPRSLLAPLLEEARASLSASLTEQAPPKSKGVPRVVRMCGSSYLVITLVDDEGRRTERRSALGPGTVSEAEEPGLRLAHRLLAPLTAVELAPGEVDEADRAFVAARMTASRESFGSERRIAEHYAHLSAFFGSPALLLPLLDTLGHLEAERPRAAALETLTRLTGWDARKNEGRASPSFEQASAAYLEACRPSPSP